MLIRFTLTTATLVFAFIACVQSPDLANVPPFSSLNIRLGMSVSAVESARPQASVAPYAGLEEQLREMRVLYTFPGTEEHIPPFASLTRVSVSTALVGDSTNSQAELYRATAELRSLLGAPNECGIVQLPFASAQVRIWRNGESQLMVGTWKEREKRSLVYALMKKGEAFNITSTESCA